MEKLASPVTIVVKMRANNEVITLLHYCILASGSSLRVAIVQLEEHGEFM